jgi:diguanylate cyclase (GGDEF)-like protein
VPFKVTRRGADLLAMGRAPSGSTARVGLPERSRFQLWGADFGDDGEMAGVRARIAAAILAVAVLLGGVERVLAPGEFRDGVRADACLAAMICLAGWILLRVQRMGEWEYLAVLLCSDLGLVLYALATRMAGGTVSPELVLFLPTLNAAVFCRRRAAVVAQTVAAMGGAAMVAAARAGGTEPVIQALLVDAFLVLAVTFTVRLLRDLARDAVQRARQGEITDPLTGLANRRGLERHGSRRWSDHAHRHLPIAVLVIDVDHFKQVNDTLGHPAGDELLRLVGGLVNDVVREDDVAVRLGGEEFLVLAQGAGIQAQELAERLRARIERELSITVSIGVHLALPGPDDELPVSLWRAVASADQALYSAKRAGRNRVVCSASVATIGAE